jgi:DNA-directed RNA polymerase subunit beta
MKLRPGDPPTTVQRQAVAEAVFFDPRRYDLSRVGRYKIEQKLGQVLGDVRKMLEGRELVGETDSRVLEAADLIAAIRYLVSLRKGEGAVDDIDHLGSRRIRTVGELLANQCRVGLARTERLVKERMTIVRSKRRQDDARRSSSIRRRCPR